MEPKTPDWVKDAVFYQIFPDRFAQSARVSKPAHLQAWDAPPTFHGFKGGDLLGIIEKLDYLTDLGINALYLNPIFASASNHRYHTHDYLTVDPLLGGNSAFMELLDSAHERGIRVVLDGVFNHASRGFFQFNHLLEAGAESPYRDWFHVYDWPVNAYNEAERPNYAAWWGFHALPKFNTDNPEVREFLWYIGEHWLKLGIDGWRLDVPSEIDDDSFWQEFRRRCKAVNPDAYIVGELWEDATRWLQGDQCDAQMNYPFSRIAYGFFGGHNLNQADTGHTGLGYLPPLDGKQFAQTLYDLHHQHHPQVIQAQLTVLSSHDTPRLITIANNDLSTVQMMFLCQLTIAGAPNIYYGDEIGLAGGRDPDSRRAFPWDNRGAWHNGLLDRVRRAIALRHEHAVLRRGDFQIVHAADQVVAYSRRYGDQLAVIAFNVDHHTQTFTYHGQADNGLPNALDKGAKALRPGVEQLLEPRQGYVWIGDA